MGAPHQPGKLQCPYSQCNKTFEKPIVMADKTKLVRETYYACPHCRSKIELLLEDPAHPKIIQAENPLVEGQRTPKQCKHNFGYLGDLSGDVDIPDECTMCPKVLLCFIRKRT